MTTYRERRLAGVHTEGSKAFLADRGLDQPAPKQTAAQVKQSTRTAKGKA